MARAVVAPRSRATATAPKTLSLTSPPSPDPQAFMLQILALSAVANATHRR
jgi:hypothetical protein